MAPFCSATLVYFYSALDILSDHIGIPQENQLDLLTEAEQVFAPKKPKADKAKGDGPSKPKPAAVKASAKKEASNKKAA